MGVYLHLFVYRKIGNFFSNYHFKLGTVSAEPSLWKVKSDYNQMVHKFDALDIFRTDFMVY